MSSLLESANSGPQMIDGSVNAHRLAPEVDASVAPSIVVSRTPYAKLWKAVFFFVKWLLGAVLCLNPLGSILVVGWSYRLIRRGVLKRWWKCSRAKGWSASFAAFTEGDACTRQYTDWPNWFVQQNGMRAVRESAGVWGRIMLPFHSLWLNLKIGVQGIFNTWVVTMPGCALWLFAWHAGWNNSFHKGYEQYWVGPLSGWVGVLLFMVAMLYVPMAQVRQAATGNWRAFYQFGLIRELVRRRWLGCLVLAALYSLVSVPINVLRAAPGFFPVISAELADMTEPEVSRFLLRYFFMTSLVLFPCYVVLRLAAGRLYASGMLSLVEDGTVAEAQLERDERLQLERLELLRSRLKPRRHILIRAVGWTGRRIARAAAFAAVLLIWFTFVAQIFIAQFILYYPGVGWLNQPLVQLPCSYFWP